jgi:NtrC-family two-component system response regulator AlgB
MSNDSPAITPLRILVIDDEDNIRMLLSMCLEADGHLVTAHGAIDPALAAVSREAFDLIFLDMRLGLDNGLDFIPQLIAQNPWTRLVVITAYASVESAVEAMKRGAADYLPKPFTPAQVQMVTQKVAERRRLEWKFEALREALGGMDAEADFPTGSAVMRRMLETARQVAASSAPVLICGEVGTGKGRLARAIHAWSGRAEAPFGIASCQCTEAEALDAELFGVTAENDAGRVEVPGRVAFSDTGTLLLDEVGGTPPSLQPKLLRLLRDKEYERLYDFRPRKADVRIVATVSNDLNDAVQQRRLRPELLLALDVVRLEIPPLRQRPEDLRLLAKRYLALFSRENHRHVSGFTQDAFHAMQQYAWPGNVRELRNLIERAVLLCRGEEIGLEHFPPNLLPTIAQYEVGDLVALEKIEEAHIRCVLASAGTLRGAATILGIDPSTLTRKLRRFSKDPLAEPRDAPPQGGPAQPATHSPQPSREP